MNDTFTARVDNAARKLRAIADVLPTFFQPFDNAADAEQEMQAIEANILALTSAVTGGDASLEVDLGIALPEPV